MGAFRRTLPIKQSVAVVRPATSVFQPLFHPLLYAGLSRRFRSDPLSPTLSLSLSHFLTFFVGEPPPATRFAVTSYQLYLLSLYGILCQ